MKTTERNTERMTARFGTRTSRSCRHPMVLAAGALALAMASGATAATITETFDTAASASANGWTASTMGGGNSFGFSNTNFATGSDGEAGGTVSRSEEYYTYLTSLPAGLDRTSTLTMSGSIYLDNNNFDGGIYLGFFDTAGLVFGENPTKFVGILIQEPAFGGAPLTDPFRGQAVVAGTGGEDGDIFSLTQEAQLTFNLTYTGSNDGSGTITGLLGGSDIGTVNVGAGSDSFNAFGMAVGGASSTAERAGEFYFDNVTYSIPEPGTLSLMGLAGLALLAGRRRRK